MPTEGHNPLLGDSSAPLLTEALPELAQELEMLLVKKEEPDLAGQIRQLRIVDRCRCDDDFCAMFYTAPRPTPSWGPGHITISLDCDRGMLNVDVVTNQVMAVEVLNRDEIRKRLQEILP